MAFIRRDVVGGAVSTTLVGSVTALSTSWQIDDATGWPLGTNGPFYAVFNRLGTQPGGPEKVLVQSLSGNTVTLSGTSSRGVDGTTAQAWAAPTSFEHCVSAVDVDEANLTVSQTVGQIVGKGDAITGRSANRFQRTPPGSNGSLYICDSSAPGGMRFSSLPDGSINTATQFADNVVENDAIVDDTISFTKLAARGYCHFSSTTAVLIPEATWTSLTTFVTTGTYDEDDDTLLASGGGGFTVPAYGDGRLWEISSGIRWDNDSGGRRLTRLNASTSGVHRLGYSHGDANSQTIGTRVVRLVAGETVNLQIFQDFGSSIRLSPEDDLHYFSARLLQ